MRLFLPMKAHLEFVHSSYSGLVNGEPERGWRPTSLSPRFPKPRGPHIHPVPRSPTLSRYIELLGGMLERQRVRSRRGPRPRYPPQPTVDRESNEGGGVTRAYAASNPPLSKIGCMGGTRLGRSIPSLVLTVAPLTEEGACGSEPFPLRSA